VRLVCAAIVAAVLITGAMTRAHASVVINIDKSTQRMTVSVDGETRHVWAVSTGRAGFGTPNGHFRPQRLARTWFSKKYYNSPMPHSIFFHHGFAIHGSYEIRRLGGPASHGCVRLHPSNAATLFALVNREGAGSTRIVVSGGNPVQMARRRARSVSVATPRPESQPAFGEPWQGSYAAPAGPQWQRDF
jgi:L,D-transpeptidase catalytic domain